MKTEEINRVNRNLAEFEGYNQKGRLIYYKDVVVPINNLPDYTDDLNKLVPIWEKLQASPSIERDLGDKVICNIWVETCDEDRVPYDKVVSSESSSTIQQAAALATEKAILALEGGK